MYVAYINTKMISNIISNLSNGNTFVWTIVCPLYVTRSSPIERSKVILLPVFIITL